MEAPPAALNTGEIRRGCRTALSRTCQFRPHFLPSPVVASFPAILRLWARPPPSATPSSRLKPC